MTTPALKSVRLNKGEVTVLVPDDWTEESNEAGVAKLRTTDGSEVRLQFREFRKPPIPGSSGPTSKDMVTMAAGSFGGVATAIVPGRAIASHPATIGESGKEQRTHVWHLVNQVGPWHHETILVTFATHAGSVLDPAIVELLNQQLVASEFANGSWEPSASQAAQPSKPWWRFW